MFVLNEEENTVLLTCIKFSFFRANRLAVTTAGASTRLSQSLNWCFETEEALLEASLRGESEGDFHHQDDAALQSEEILQIPSAFVNGRPISEPVATRYPLGTRKGRRRYVRDSLTLPAMVIIYNTLVVWVLFNIDVRASAF